MRKWLVGMCAAVIAIAVISGSVSAQQTPLIRVSAACQVVPEGYRYRITVRNDTDPADGYYVGLLTLNVWYPSEYSPDPFGLQSPSYSWTGFISSGGAADRVEWFVQDDYLGGIAPGDSVSSFGFRSAVLVDHIAYEADGWNGSIGVWSKGILYPEPVPEPSSLLALGIGALGLAGALRGRKRHQLDALASRHSEVH